MKTKGTAAILAFLGGGIGVHRFYLGQAGLGLIYLLMCWTFIPAVLAFFEALYFAMMNDDEFDRRYNAQHLQLQAQPAPAQMGQNVTVNLAGGPAAGVDVAEQLQKLNDLRVAGVLSDEEFHAQKRKILS